MPKIIEEWTPEEYEARQRERQRESDAMKFRHFVGGLLVGGCLMYAIGKLPSTPVTGPIGMPPGPNGGPQGIPQPLPIADPNPAGK